MMNLKFTHLILFISDSSPVQTAIKIVVLLALRVRS
jgi:hypothetical protein